MLAAEGLSGVSDNLRIFDSQLLEHPRMLRAAYIVIVVMACYLIDRFAFDGRYYSETKIIANNLAAKSDYQVKAFLRPIGR